MPGPVSSTQSGGDGSETSPVLTTGVAPLPPLEQGQTSNSTETMDQGANGVARLETAVNPEPVGGSRNSTTPASTAPPSTTTSSMPPSAPVPSPISGVANAGSSSQPSQSSHRVPFGPPPPPPTQSSPSRPQATYANNGIPEGVIQGILQGLFGPMTNVQRSPGSGSNSADVNARQADGNHGPTPNSTSGGRASGPPPDLGPVFSMFGMPPLPTPPSGTTAASPQQQGTDTASTQANTAPAAAAGPSSAQRHRPFGPSEFSFTFDLGPIEIPGMNGGNNVGGLFGNPSNGSETRNATQDAGAQGRPDDRSRHPEGAFDMPRDTASGQGSTGHADNGANTNNRPPPLTFILGPNGNWMQPNAGAGGPTGTEGNNLETNNQPAVQNGNSDNGGDGGNQPPPLAPPLFHIFSRLLQNGLQPGGTQPGIFNFAFGFPSFMQTRLPPDPERAEELLRGLKDPGMDLMIRLDRVVRADNTSSGSTGGQDAGSEGDADGWKCAVCMEGLEDEFEAHKQNEAVPHSADHVEAEASGSKDVERISRTNSLASDSDMHDVEMALNGETRENSKNRTSLKVFPCHHVFHEDCLKPWLAQKTTCPTCRFDIDPHSVTLRRPVMPQGRANPLRPRTQNAATSNVRATPYGSRPISPSRTGDASNQTPSGLTRTRPMSSGEIQGSLALAAETQATASGDAPSTTGPTFSQSEVPRSPFAFPRPDRNNLRQTNTFGHVDRPPPAAQSAGPAASNPDEMPLQNNNSGAGLTPGGMQDAVRMLHELMNRVGRHDVPGAGPLNNNASDNSGSPPAATASGSTQPHQINAADNQPDQSNHDMDVDGDRDRNEDDHHAHTEQDRSRHPHSHTIAIFEIAIPNMPADMMPDSFQGLNDGAPQPFGPNAFRSFMVPFPGSGPNNEDGNHADDNDNNNNSADHTTSSAENSQNNANLDASQGTNEADHVGPGRAPTVGGPGHQPPRPHLHRWMSDSEQRPTSSFPLPPMMNLPPLDGHRPDSDSAPIERRRGDEQWTVPRVKETFAEWIMAREKALHWRCDDHVCLHAPPEHPFTDTTEEEWQEWKPTTEKLVKIKSYKQHQFVGEEYTGPRPVCQHEFHPSCLKISCLSSNWWYREPGREETTVRCPRCRTQGWVIDESSDVQLDVTTAPQAVESA